MLTSRPSVPGACIRAACCSSRRLGIGVHPLSVACAGDCSNTPAASAPGTTRYTSRTLMAGSPEVGDAWSAADRCVAASLLGARGGTSMWAGLSRRACWLPAPQRCAWCWCSRQCTASSVCLPVLQMRPRSSPRAQRLRRTGQSRPLAAGERVDRRTGRQLRQTRLRAASCNSLYIPACLCCVRVVSFVL